MANPIVYNATFYVTVKPEYSTYGVSGYMIGSRDFRSMTTLNTALNTAFGKDFGTYRFLEVQIVYNKGTEQRRVLCTAENYSAVLISIEDDLEEEKMTLNELLGD